MNNIKEIAQRALDVLEPIPEDQFITGQYNVSDRCCSLGYLNKAWNKEACWTENDSAAINVYISMKYPNTDELGKQGMVYINDEITDEFPQPTPKQRVVALLKDIISKEV